MTGGYDRAIDALRHMVTTPAARFHVHKRPIEKGYDGRPLQLFNLSIDDGAFRFDLQAHELEQLRDVLSNALGDRESLEQRLAVATSALDAITRELRQLAGRAERIRDGEP